MNKNIKCIVAVTQEPITKLNYLTTKYKDCEEKPTWISPSYFKSTGNDGGYCEFHMKETIRWLGKYADSHKTKEGHYNLHNCTWMPIS